LTNLLGTAIGRCLARESGLMGAYLPRDLSIEEAAAIVAGANEIRDVSPAFAILVAGDKPPHDGLSSTDIVSIRNAVKWRQGDRLAVICGSPGLIQSLTGVYRSVIGASYPKSASGVVALESVAAELLSLILGNRIAALTQVEIDEATETLDEALRLSSGIHESLGSGAVSWNCRWFRHVGGALENIRQGFLHLPADTGVADALAVLTFPAFGLPRPSPGARRLTAPAGAFARAISEFWSSESKIANSIAAIGEHDLDRVDWTRFDATVVKFDDPFTALGMHPSEGSLRTLAFAALTEMQFLDPFARAATMPLRLFDARGQILTIGDHSSSASVLPISGHDESGAFQLSIPIRIEIPLLQVPSKEVIARSQLELQPSSKNVSLRCDLELVNDSLEAVGTIMLRDPELVAGSLPSPFSLATRVPPGDCLQDAVPSGARMLLYPTSLHSAAIAVFPRKSDGQLATGTYFSSESGVQGEAECVIEITKSSAHKVLVWGQDVDVAPIVEGQTAVQLFEGLSIWACDFEPPQELIVKAGQTSFRLTIGDTAAVAATPLLAALQDAALDRARRPEAVTETIRGVFEDRLVNTVVDGSWEQCLGHHVVTSRHGDADFSTVRDGSLCVAAEILDEWQVGDALRIPAELLESNEVRRFRNAFDDLGIPQAVRVDDSDGNFTHAWISQTSLRYLGESGDSRVDAYLEAYSELIEHARVVGDPAGVFWAAYPFSFSVWELGFSPHATAVFLSPLHPLRLAWLVRFETALADVESGLGASIAGTVEGWNLPALGPREISANYMAAIPVESGPYQVFAGWSLLVRLSNEFAQPTAPVRVGGRRAPGSSTSGLNATAVESSIRDFRKIHPHLSTIAIDLSAANDRARSNDVDEVVRQASKKLLSDGLVPLPGGVRVFDSMRRAGEMSEETLSSIGSSNAGAPLVWKRYNPSTQTPKSHLRILEDAGVNIKVSDAAMTLPSAGILARSGLRRFDVGAIASTHNTVASYPALRNDHAPSPFSRALRVLESGAGNPVVETRINRLAFTSGAADWTVSGEGSLNPSVMADLLANAAPTQEQVLWEWRPPFLDAASGNALLERRPYISVVRLPSSFRLSLRERLEIAMNGAVDEAVVANVLRKLGSRGIGLSSLLAIGGAHTTGALGFYLALSLLDASAPRESERLVLPIDSCNRFLRALAGDEGSEQVQERADLLVMDLLEDGLELTPIEVKYYGPDVAGANLLPEIDSSKLAKPISQLNATCGLLKKLAAVASEISLRSTGTQDLWWTAMASLVDIGLRLSPSRVMSLDEVSHRFNRVLTGDAQITVGRPVVLYFKQDGTQAGTGSSFVAGVVNDSLDNLTSGFRALVADPSVVFSELQASGPLFDAWLGLMDPDEADTLSDDCVDPPVEGDETPREPTRRELGGWRGDWQSRFASSDGIRFPVGKLIDAIGDADVDYWPSNTKLNQMNIGVVGDLGTGKTQFLRSLIYNLRGAAAVTQETPLSVLVFDYKKDFQDQEFLNAVGGRVLTPSRIPLNIFALSGEYSRTIGYQRARAFTDVITKIYGGVGPVQSNRLIEVIQDLYEARGGEPPTLRRVRDEYVSRSGNPDSVVSVLNIFVEGEVFDDEIENLVPFSDLLDDKVLVVALSHLGTDQLTKNAIVVLFLNAYYEYMHSRTKWPFVGEDPILRTLNSYLVVDEATNILQYDFSVLKSVLLQGREFGVGVVLASQYLDHFKVGQENYGQALSSWVIHKVPSVSAKQLQSLGVSEATESDAKRISGLGLHEAFYKSLDPDARFVRGIPFFELVKDAGG
jgi:DNA phosphorothioation-dependent restriction protein DptH